MILKWIFDRVVALIGLLVLWPVLLIVAVLVKVKMPGGKMAYTRPDGVKIIPLGCLKD